MFPHQEKRVIHVYHHAHIMDARLTNTDHVPRTMDAQLYSVDQCIKCVIHPLIDKPEINTIHPSIDKPEIT